MISFCNDKRARPGERFRAFDEWWTPNYYHSICKSELLLIFRHCLILQHVMSLFTYSEPAQIGLRVAFALLVTVNLFGNSMVCLVVLRNRSMRNAMNYLLVSLACADMMVAIFIAPQYIFLHTYNHPRGLAGDYLCKVLTGGNLMWTGGVVSVVSLIAIAFERYFAVLYPHDEKRRISKTKLKFIIPACWVFAFIWNFPLFLLLKYDEVIDFCYEDWPSGWYMNAYSLGWLIVIGIIPLTIMASLYTRVVFNLWVTTSQPVELTQRAVIKSRKRVTKMVLIVTVVCAVCWLPNLIVYVLDFYGMDSHGGIVHTTTVVLVTLNSAVNPIIYCFQSKRFRGCVKALLLSPCSLRRTAIVEPCRNSLTNLAVGNRERPGNRSPHTPDVMLKSDAEQFRNNRNGCFT
ncbi:QRFP-like peptide receptor isoform X1 [Oculina patagonica]